MEPELIIEVIKNIRKEKGLTQLEMAEKLEMKQSSYGKIERGEVDISIGKLFKILKVLEEDPKNFFSIIGDGGLFFVSHDIDLQGKLEDLKIEMKNLESEITFLKEKIDYYKVKEIKKDSHIEELEGEIIRQKKFMQKVKEKGWPKATDPPF